MPVTIDRESWVPVYLQIAQHIRIMILEGDLASGMLLPTLRDLSSSLGVSRKTVIRAYRVLQCEGLVKGCGRRGTQVTTPEGFCSDILPIRPDRKPRASDLRSVVPAMASLSSSTVGPCLSN